jgi:hypothetical protein
VSLDVRQIRCAGHMVDAVLYPNRHGSFSLALAPQTDRDRHPKGNLVKVMSRQVAYFISRDADCELEGWNDERQRCEVERPRKATNPESLRGTGAPSELPSVYRCSLLLQGPHVTVMKKRLRVGAPATR